MNTSRIVVGGYAAVTEPGVRAFEYNPASHELTALGSFAGIENPTFVVPHHAQPWVYAVSEASTGTDGNGSVWALRYNGETKTFEAINSQSSGGAGPCHVVLDRTGSWVIVSNYSGGSVTVLPVNDDGSLGPMSDHRQHSGSSVHPERQGGPYAHSAIFTPDERWVIVADLGIDQLVVYAWDAQRGTLAPHGPGDARPGAGPRHMAFHPQGKLLYVANELDNTVGVYEYDSDHGTLRSREVVNTLPAGAPLSYVADIHVTHAGRHLIVSNRGHNSLAVFEIGDDGALSLIATPSCGGDWPRNFAIAPNDNAVLVANQRSGTITIHPISDGVVVADAPAATTEVPGVSCIQWIEW